MTTTAVAVKWPDILREHAAEMETALTVEVPAMWHEEETFKSAEQAAAIGAVLVEGIHTHLSRANIAYLFREKMAKLDRVVLGRASKADAKLTFFNGFDLLVEINWEQWRQANGPQRVALVDHELCHFGFDVNDAGRPVYSMLAHDVEEFGGIVERWGLWKSDLKKFSDTLAKAQRDLFIEAK